jgi:hypothetical protein
VGRKAALLAVQKKDRPATTTPHGRSVLPEHLERREVPGKVELIVSSTFRIADVHEHREWQGWVGFTSVPMRQLLLGYAGVLQFFSAHFHGDREEVSPRRRGCSAARHK